MRFSTIYDKRMDIPRHVIKVVEGQKYFKIKYVIHKFMTRVYIIHLENLIAFTEISCILDEISAVNKAHSEV